MNNLINISKFLLKSNPVSANIVLNIGYVPARCLFSAASIGIDNYLTTRKRAENMFTNKEKLEAFKAKMEEFVGDDPKAMIFTEDLKNMIHVSSPENLELIMKMIRKFNTQNTEHRFGLFKFGPVVMRMFHHFNEPELALKCFQDPINEGFFDQHTSYQILMDLLYKNEKYDEALKVYEYIKMKQVEMTKFPKYIMILVMATCYKMNSQQSLEYASQVWREMNEVGTRPLRRTCTFFAALALNQGAPHIALEVIAMLKQNYVSIRNIKVMALSNVGRVDDALPVLRSILNIDVPGQEDKHTYLQEAIDVVAHAVSQSHSGEVRREFESIRKALEERNLIDKKPLDELICSEIQKSQSTMNQSQQKLHLSYQGSRQTMPYRRRYQADRY